MNFPPSGDQRNARFRIREGDTCVIHISDTMRYLLRIQPDQTLQTKFGLLKAADLIGHPYGHQYECKKGWVLPLRLTPELWTQMVPHRTQILYQADISLILLYLDIKPGSVVVESGTGSGSLSHSILRACSPHGHLHTFEFNESRFKEASREFQEHGYSQNASVYHRNVCQEGFDEKLVGTVDACMLDLPQTWDAIGHAYKVMKPYGSKLCTFSPCIEQVQRNVAMMNQLKLKDIVTYECLMRPLEIREHNLRLWDETTMDKLIEVDKKKLELVKTNFDPAKRLKGDGVIVDEANPRPAQSQNGQPVRETNCDDLLDRSLTNPRAQFNPNMLPKWVRLCATKPRENVTHSGYLTFATK